MTTRDGEIELARESRVADTHWSRLRGLLGRPRLKRGEGLLLVPCRAVVTWGMGYPIDVVFADERGRVVATCPELRPWRRSGVHRDARWALELPAGTLARAGVGPGDDLRLCPSTEGETPPAGDRGRT